MNPSRPREGSTMYYSLWRLPAAQRHDVCTLLHFIHTLASSLHDVSEPTVAEQKIHWWHEEVERLGQGQARHPSSVAVQPLVQRYAIQTHDFLPVLQANNQEKFNNASTDTELGERLMQDYGTRLRLCERVLQTPASCYQDTITTTSEQSIFKEQESSEQPSLAPAWAIGLGEIERLRQLVFLHHRAYPVFPDDAYNAVNLPVDKLTQADQQDAVSTLLTQRIDLALAALEEALAGEQAESRAASRAAQRESAGLATSLPLIIYAQLRHKQLLQWRQEPLKLITEYTTLTPVKKFWFTWRLRRQLHR